MYRYLSRRRLDDAANTRVRSGLDEGLLRSFHAVRGPDYPALRYFNVHGPQLDISGRYTDVLIRWVRLIEAGQPPLILGDGTQTMDLVFTGDNVLATLVVAPADVMDEVSGDSLDELP